MERAEEGEGRQGRVNLLAKNLKKGIDFFLKALYNVIGKSVGVWRRLVARYLGVVEVVGSSPVTPTRSLSDLYTLS